MDWENIGGAKLSNEFRMRALIYINRNYPEILRPYQPDFRQINNRLLLTILRIKHPEAINSPGTRRGDYRFFIDKLPSLPAFVTKNLKDKRLKFYESREWRNVRYSALIAANGICQCCGNRPSKDNPLHVDHIKPRSKYPELELEVSNLQVLCADCNLGKSNRDETDWRESVQ